MVNRMKPFIDTIISANQRAFIPGHLISDNILVSFEILHYLRRKRKGKDGYMTLKLDMSKAYDRVDWSFLEAMLRKLGFANHWVQLILNCVSSASYKVIHGAHEIGPILPTGGIRQGDPLSPYLFILCAEGFSAFLRKYENRGWLHGCKVANGAPRISHMLFADDNYLNSKATYEEAHRIKEVLQKFELASGQRVNFANSSIFFSANTTDDNKERIVELLGVPIALEGSMYLGLPSSMGRNKMAALSYLKEKLRKQLQSWGSKFLSRESKEILIKTVAQALPSYLMSVFLLPLEIVRDMESMMAKLLVQSIPVLSRPTMGTLNWSLDLSGLYSMKSAYKLLHQLNGEFGLDVLAEDSCSSCVGSGGYWHGIATGDLFFGLCMNQFEMLDLNSANLLVALCWAIWNARNDKVWQDKVMGIEGIVASTTNYLNQWRVAQNSNNELLFTGFIPGDGAEQWSAQSVSSIKVIDAAVFNDSSTYGVGFVARDSSSFFVEGSTKLFHGSISPVVAEVIGVWEALSWIKDHSLLNVTLETDCLSIVQTVRSSMVIISLFGKVVSDCKNLLSTLRNVSFHFVKRSVNVAAHSFARASISHPDRLFNLDTVLIELLPNLVTEIFV
uniref:Reverse transcriptase domain-containing protein n=1 Tax=Cannabis sativa TaxID=3483 RepID=A0A803PV44_CANSA